MISAPAAGCTSSSRAGSSWRGMTAWSGSRASWCSQPLRTSSRKTGSPRRSLSASCCGSISSTSADVSAPQPLLHRAANGIVAEVLEEVASPAVVTRDLERDHLDPALLGPLLRFLHQQPAVVLSTRLARHAQRGDLKGPGPVACNDALREPEMPEVAAVDPFQDPELRAGAAKAVPAESHLHVEKGGEALLEDGALLLRRVAEPVELRLQLQSGELLPILRGIWAQARHGARVSEMWAGVQAGPCIRPQFPLEGAFRFLKERSWHARSAVEQGQAQARSRRSLEAWRRAAAAGRRCAIQSAATSSRRSRPSLSRSACTRRWTRSAAPSSTF